MISPPLLARKIAVKKPSKWPGQCADSGKNAKTAATDAVKNRGE